MNKIGIFRQ